MRYLIITNIRENKGLLKDSNIVSTLLLEAGHNVCVVDFRDEYFPKNMDVAIHLEVVDPKYFMAARQHWWIPNPDWCKPDCLEHLNRFTYILCKTRYAERVFRGLYPKPNAVVYTGFASEDRYDSTVLRERVFFHAHRDSIVKGTDAVLSARQRFDFPLVMADNFTDEEMKKQQNRCLFHLQPSQNEGFAHILWEGMSCGAIVVSTDVAPMNEFSGIAKHIKPVLTSILELAQVGIVNPEGVIDAVDWCNKLNDTEIAKLSKNAREQYLIGRKEFRERFGELIGHSV